jgi:hypothetical protein
MISSVFWGGVVSVVLWSNKTSLTGIDFPLVQKTLRKFQG